MMWTKLDDRFHAHPKVAQAWKADRASIGLYTLALSHASAYLTDGHVSEEFVRTHIPNTAQRRRATDALLDAGLWERNGDGWLIHDFLDYNRSAADMREKQSASRARAAAPARAPGPTGARTPERTRPRPPARTSAPPSRPVTT